jgi:hypothetical protein
VTLKLADLSSRFNNEGVVDYVSCVFFAHQFEDLPCVQNIGDIIRVHRADVGTYKEHKQLTANISFNSSWALFPSQFTAKTKAMALAEEFNPSEFFGKSCQVAEHKLIRSLRKWVKDNFMEKDVLSSQYIVPLDKVAEYGAAVEYDKGKFKFNDFDLQVKVVQLFKIDKYQSEMRVIDQTNQIWHVNTFNRKYQTLRQGQYVRIRAGTLVNHSKGYERTFGLRPYSNILALPFPCKLAEDMIFDEIAQHKEFEVK